MKIENTNNIIRIRFDGFLSCLYIKKPRVVDWPDHGGSVARYFACLPFNEWDREMQNEIETRLSRVDTIQGLKDSGFLELLESGEYEFEVFKNRPTSIIYNTNLYNSNEIIYLWNKKRLGNHRGARPYFLDSFYPYGLQLMFTQPFETLDGKRIKYYENKIRNGERPYAIAIRVKIAGQDDEDSYQDTTYNSTKYVLDGHHKLVAYENLNLAPNFILINRTSNGTSEIFDESSLPELNPYLLYFQIEHIVNNSLETMKLSPRLAKYIDRFLIEAPRFEDTLVRTLHRSVYYEGYETDEKRKLWLKERLGILIKRVNSNPDVYFDYFNANHKFRKYDRVRNWNELMKIMEKQL